MDQKDRDTQGDLGAIEVLCSASEKVNILFVTVTHTPTFEIRLPYSFRICEYSCLVNNTTNYDVGLF